MSIAPARLNEGTHGGVFDPPRPVNYKATICLPTNKVPKPENVLKAKDRESDFSFTKPENILKTKAVTKNCRNLKKYDTVSGTAHTKVAKIRARNDSMCGQIRA